MQHLGGEVVTTPVCQGEWRATQSITIWYTAFAWKKMLGKETHLFSIKKRTKCKATAFCVGTGPQAIFVFIYVFVFIIALTLLESEGQMACDCLVALHVSMFGLKCLQASAGSCFRPAGLPKVMWNSKGRQEQIKANTPTDRQLRTLAQYSTNQKMSRLAYTQIPKTASSPRSSMSVLPFVPLLSFSCFKRNKG